MDQPGLALLRGGCWDRRSHNGSTFLDGPHSIKDESIVITSARQAREVVREHERRGFDLLKVYDYLAPEVYHALAGRGQ